MNKTRFLTLITAVLTLTVYLIIPAFATTIPKPSASFYVSDGADILTEDTENHIISQNNKLFYSTGSQIVFATMRSLPENVSIRDYTKAIYKEWDVSSTETQNGILVLIYIAEDPKDDNYWVVQGKGIDQELTSSKLKSMTDNYLHQYILSQDYDKGARTFFDKLLIEIADIYNIELDKVSLPEGGVDPNGNPISSGGIGSVILTVFIVLVVLAIIVIIGLIIIRNISSRNYRRRNYKPVVAIPPGARRPAGLPPHSNMPRQGGQRPAGNMPRQNTQRPTGNMPRQNTQRPTGNMPRQNTQRPTGNMPRQNTQRPAGNMPRQNTQRPAGNMPRQGVDPRNIRR